ncbi:phosphotransferase [Pyrodictium delaneyi]|uniref:Aminoglycoside phosphotransferase domain-containing protein n=1 Tax=Pyrodictium delaneyi TaxID=1273541 RepID=A0A211YQ74_9CREN|nr:phosphotransferase [Pyrodictium delaneyi]OWJ55149.1 hypothetical protein Pdsh_05580 [Pyrodictium delaneyi]
MQGECAAAVKLTYELPGLRLVLGLGSNGSCVDGRPGWLEAIISRDVFLADVEESLLGEIIASLLLLKPVSVEGDVEQYHRLIESYIIRVFREEVSRLEKLFHKNYERLLVADIYPVVARMARLQRIYPWLRVVYQLMLQRRDYYSWLRVLVQRILGVNVYKSRWIPAKSVIEQPKRARLKPFVQLSGAVKIVHIIGDIASSVSLSLLQAIPQSIILEGISRKPHPLTRDPLLLVRLDSARVATKLMQFEDQLYTITGVKRLLDNAKLQRKGMIRSAKTVEIGGFRPAVVKRYTDITAVKWLAAAIASLPLPRPRLRALARLNAEYYYNRFLAERGFHVPEPILIDPRRRQAAYSYIEGEDLIAMLQKESTPEPYRELGVTLARLHAAGIALWDSNPSNFVYDGENLYIVDLEQARDLRNMQDAAWDIAVACYYSLLYTPQSGPERASLIASGYLEAGGRSEVLIEAAKHKYMAPFLAVVPPNILEKTRKAILVAARTEENQP